MCHPPSLGPPRVCAPSSNALTCMMCTRSQSRARSEVRAADVLASGHVRGRLPRPACDVAQMLRRRDVRSRAPKTHTQDPWGPTHVYRPAAVCDRAAAGSRCPGVMNIDGYLSRRRSCLVRAFALVELVGCLVAVSTVPPPWYELPNSLESISRYSSFRSLGRAVS